MDQSRPRRCGHGLLYTSRMRPGVERIPVEEYRETGRTWAYEQ
ncbi:hypothetical protein [Streptomyces sp. NPDC055709]